MAATCSDNCRYKYSYDDLKPSKVGQGGLVFGVLSGWASRPAHTRLQVSVYTGYDLCHCGCSKMFLSSIYILLMKLVKFFFLVLSYYY